MCNFLYRGPNLNLLGSKRSQHALLIVFEGRQKNASLFAESRQSQHFCVDILDGGGL